MLLHVHNDETDALDFKKVPKDKYLVILGNRKGLDILRTPVIANTFIVFAEY